MADDCGTGCDFEAYISVVTGIHWRAAIEHLAKNFWNIRGDFKIAQVLNIGTQMSLVRRPSGTFLLIDAYEMDEASKAELFALTDDGSKIEAVLNVHPFHTVHCEYVQNLLPNARLIGTQRHRDQLSDLRWDTDLIEDQATQQQFADCLEFSIPSGVNFVPADESVHVSSVLVRHEESKIVHVDDTLMYLNLPPLIEKFGAGPKLRFHPKLSEGLEKRPGAADDYVRWARGLASDWSDTKIICAAHKGIMRLNETTFAEAIETALDHSADTLTEHRKAYS